MLRSVPLALALLCFGLAPAHATAIYTYHGKRFEVITDVPDPAGTYTTDMRVTGTITLDAPLPARTVIDRLPSNATWSFTDGRHTITHESTSGGTFRIVTEDNGEFSADVRVSERPTSGPSQLHSISIDGSSRDRAAFWSVSEGIDRAQSGRPGSWTLSLPEPGTTLMLLATVSGLLARPSRSLKGKREGVSRHT